MYRASYAHESIKYTKCLAQCWLGKRSLIIKSGNIYSLKSRLLYLQADQHFSYRDSWFIRFRNPTKMTCKPLNFKDNSLIIICQNDYLLWDFFWSTCALYVPLLTLAWQPLGAEVYVFSSTLRQQVFGICELVAWHDPDVVHQDVASKSFVVDTTGFTPQQSSYIEQR